MREVAGSNPVVPTISIKHERLPALAAVLALVHLGLTRMYRIPENLDLSPVVGEFTTQVRVGQFDLQFTFGPVHFAVQSRVNLFRDGEIVAYREGGLVAGYVPISSCLATKSTRSSKNQQAVCAFVA